MLIAALPGVVSADDDLLAFIDRSAPEFTISGNRTQDNVMIFKGSAYDKYSGVDSILVSVDGGEFKPVSFFADKEGGEWQYNYVIPEECSRYANFTFKAIDTAGNEVEINKEKVEVYNKVARLTYIDGLLPERTYYPENVQGEPVRAVATISGRGHDYAEINLPYPDFSLNWNGYFGDYIAPDGNYLVTIRTYNKTGQYSTSTTQMLVSENWIHEQKNDPDRYRHVDINGYIDSMSKDNVIVNGNEYIITEDSIIENGTKPGTKVTGLGKFDVKNGTIEIIQLRVVPDRKYNLPEYGVATDEKIGEEEFSGIVEAVGEDYIIVNGMLIAITDKTELNCEFSEIRPGDFVSGVTEIFSQSGRKAVICLKAEAENIKKQKIAGHVVDMGDGWVEIDVDGMRFIITGSTIIEGEYSIGDMILVEYLDPVNEAVSIKKPEKAPCTELPAYYYGEVFGIFPETNEIVVDDLIHIPDEKIYYDLDIAEFEVHSFAALVDLNCSTRVLRVVQNAGETLPNDRIIGTVTEIGDKDINGNTPVFIDGKYTFSTDKTNLFSGLKKNMTVAAVKVGDELISASIIPEASIDVDELSDFVGTVAKVFGDDNQGNRYVSINGVTYRLRASTVLDESVGEFEKGAIVSGTVLNDTIVQAAVIKAKAEDINKGNAFVGTIEKTDKINENEYKIKIDGASYTADENTLIYSDTQKGAVVMAVQDKGYLLALRDYPSRISSERPAMMTGLLDYVSAKDSNGNFTVELNGEEFTVDETVTKAGYFAKGMSYLALGFKNLTGEFDLSAIFVDNAIDILANHNVSTGKIGTIGLADDSGLGTIIINGFPYTYSSNTFMEPLNEGTNIIFAYDNDQIIAAADVHDDDIYFDPEVFSGEISSISDMQTDGSYVLDLTNGTRISLTKDTLLNDSNAFLEPDIVLSGIRFGNMAYIASTYGSGNIDVRDVAFSGVVEDTITDPDGKTQVITVRNRDYNVNGISDLIDKIDPGVIVAGSMKPGKNVLSMTVIKPEELEGDVVSIGGFIESITASDDKGERQMKINDSLYRIPETAAVSGNLANGARVSAFVREINNTVVLASVVESYDQGTAIDGTVDVITSEHVSAPDKSDWKHISLAGIYNLFSDDSVELTGEIKEKDKVHGFIFGEEREILAVLREDNSIAAKIKEIPTPVLIGTAAAGGTGTVGLLLLNLLRKKKMK